jgi:hypothetical protein
LLFLKSPFPVLPQVVLCHHYNPVLEILCCLP